MSGDVVLPSGRIDRRWIRETNRIVAARPDIHVIRYTHAWRKLSPDMFSYTVNASCETAADVLEATAAGWQTVLVGSSLIGQTLAGKRVIQCPEQTHGVTCQECRLCSKPRQSVIAFAPHGSGRKRVLSVVGS